MNKQLKKPIKKKLSKNLIKSKKSILPKKSLKIYKLKTKLNMSLFKFYQIFKYHNSNGLKK